MKPPGSAQKCRRRWCSDGASHGAATVPPDGAATVPPGHFLCHGEFVVQVRGAAAATRKRPAHPVAEGAAIAGRCGRLPAGRQGREKRRDSCESALAGFPHAEVVTAVQPADYNGTVWEPTLRPPFRGKAGFGLRASAAPGPSRRPAPWSVLTLSQPICAPRRCPGSAAKLFGGRCRCGRSVLAARRVAQGNTGGEPGAVIRRGDGSGPLRTHPGAALMQPILPNHGRGRATLCRAGPEDAMRRGGGQGPSQTRPEERSLRSGFRRGAGGSARREAGGCRL